MCHSLHNRIRISACAILRNALRPGADFAGAEGVIPLRAGRQLAAYAFTPEKICLRTLA